MCLVRVLCSFIHSKYTYKASAAQVSKFSLHLFADYQTTLRHLDGDALDAAKKQCHQRGADRLLELAFKNGGIYIKLGQHIACLDYLLPSEYVMTMRAHLLDRCPISPFSSVRQIILEDFGAPLEELFSDFEEAPVASASLAQVHIARDKETGEKLAVKVQHRGLRETSAVDIATIEFVVKAVKVLAGVDYFWLVEEVKENLPAELDFLQEAANADRCARNLASPACKVRGKVVVPRIDHAKTSHRVCTMEFVDGVKVVDVQALKKLGAPPAAVARLISQTFNEMIFTFGDIHADPHAANMLVRRAPKGSRQRWQLVLLDHGLYRRLDDSFRIEYAHLWRSLIFSDVPGIERSARAMNAGQAVPLFAGMLTRRPWKTVSKKRHGADRLALKGTQEERDEIQQYTKMYASEIGELLARLPRELLLLLKTNDNLRAVDAELGAGVSTTIITARECTRALREAEGDRRGWRSSAASLVEAVKLEVRLTGLRAMVWLEPLRAALWVDDNDDEEEDVQLKGVSGAA